MTNEEVLHGVKEERNILHKIKKRKANWIGHILRRNCLIKRVIERMIDGKFGVTARRGRRRMQLLHDLKRERKKDTGILQLLPWQKLHLTRRRIFISANWT